ncbi:hypothetical protein BGZ80_000254 [Entomortierella chlamydospora]|uniref:DUF676 domain-containing protein n=1 Tax=Entomortierella chlamydospora TaxID=101097 RepID=A0A9P6SYP8_9FUNG|nr:hypothetical protein BGZ79_009558 [Entomortierella chlamydospora]KAG0012020.1 hypothetical protein BGZ80_000254 [Entomortierella chlamydospora]
MLMSATSFLASQIRSTIAATVHSTNTLVTSLKSSLGYLGKDSSTSEPENQSALSSVPLRHEQYPSLQPWKGLDRRLKNYGYTMPVSSNYIAPRYPIVLCHGLFGFDKMGPDAIPHLQIHYWKGIHQALNKLGAKVIVARVPRTGSIIERAEDLHKILSTTMEGSPVNFVAHSMGGLDCRYLISHIHNKNYEVLSLTTLSTPHRGSPMMDWFRDNFGVGLLLQSEEDAMRKLGEAAKLSKEAVQEASDALHSYLQNVAGRVMSSGYRAAPNPSPISPLLNKLIPYLDTPAYANLTTTYCKEVFNPNTPDDPRVSYYSYGASVPQIPLWAPLGFPWEVIKAKEGENDGLVSLQSARWGEYVETVEADHWDLNNRWRLKIGYDQKPFDAIDMYMNVATRLYNNGF